MFNSQCSILIRTEGGRTIGERLAIRHPLRLRIAHWELNIGQIQGLMRSSGYCQVIFARALSFRLMRTAQNSSRRHALSGAVPSIPGRLYCLLWIHTLVDGDREKRRKHLLPSHVAEINGPV